MKVRFFLFLFLLGLGIPGPLEVTAAEGGYWFSTFINQVQAPSNATLHGGISQQQGGGAIVVDPKLIGTTHPGISGQSMMAVDVGLLKFPIPTVVQARPADGSEGWPYQWFALKFDMPLDPESVNESTVTLKWPGGQIQGKVFLFNNDDTVLFTADSELIPDAVYTITVYPEIKSKLGTSPNNLRIFTFKSAGQYTYPPEFSMTWVQSKCEYHKADKCDDFVEGHCDWSISDGKLVSIDNKSNYSVKIRTNHVEKITDTCNHVDIPVSPGPFEMVINFPWDGGQYATHYTDWGNPFGGEQMPAHEAGSKRECDVRVYGFDGSPPLIKSYSYWCP